VRACRAEAADDYVVATGRGHTVKDFVAAAFAAAGIGDWEPLADALALSETPIFADLGHLHGGSRLLNLAARADLVVVVGRPDPTSVIRMRERLSRLAPELGAVRGVPPRFFPILVTTARHGTGDLADLASILDDSPAKPFLAGSGFVALDPPAVRRLESGDEPTGRLARTDLMRSARAVIERVAQAVGVQAPDRANVTVSGGLS
jgi:hypothetical protein